MGVLIYDARSVIVSGHTMTHIVFHHLVIRNFHFGAFRHFSTHDANVGTGDTIFVRSPIGGMIVIARYASPTRRWLPTFNASIKLTRFLVLVLEPNVAFGCHSDTESLRQRTDMINSNFVGRRYIEQNVFAADG